MRKQQASNLLLTLSKKALSFQNITFHVHIDDEYLTSNKKFLPFEMCKSYHNVNVLQVYSSHLQKTGITKNV